MYLRQFNIKNFRAIEQAEILFNRGLNVIIGENNSGKSALIDALRICFNYGNQWRDIYVRFEDFYIDITNPNYIPKQIEFDLFFEINNPAEASIYYELLVQKEGKQQIELHFRYYIEEKKRKEKIRWKVWGGENEGQQIPTDMLDLINHKYLEAMRDSEQYLKPIRWNKLGELFDNLSTDGEKMLDKEYKKELADELTESLIGNERWKKLIKHGEEKIKEHFKETSIQGKEKDVEVSFIPYEFRQIVDILRIQFPIFDLTRDLNGDKKQQKYFSLIQNGLGDNNLLYAATVLGDIINQQLNIEPEAYYALLIEEPEAHLHPQKQNTFFSYLNKLDKKRRIRKDDFSRINGIDKDESELLREQLRDKGILDSHYVVVDELDLRNDEGLDLDGQYNKYRRQIFDILQQSQNSIQLFITSHSPTITAKVDLSSLIVMQLQNNTVSALPLKQTGLSENNRKYLSKFLDVTKSQLFFSNGTLLVEGISEALLLPVFAKIMKKEYDLTARGIEIVNIDGVAFEHFANLYNSADKKKRLPCRCAIITDDDRNRETEEIPSRAKNAENLRGGNLEVVLARDTFEFELFNAGNQEILVEVFNGLKPRKKSITKGVSYADFYGRAKHEKSELAHALAIRLETESSASTDFKVPEYIQTAIEWVLGVNERA